MRIITPPSSPPSPSSPKQPLPFQRNDKEVIEAPFYKPIAIIQPASLNQRPINRDFTNLETGSYNDTSNSEDQQSAEPSMMYMVQPMNDQEPEVVVKDPNFEYD